MPVTSPTNLNSRERFVPYGFPWQQYGTFSFSIKSTPSKSVEEHFSLLLLGLSIGF